MDRTDAGEIVGLRIDILVILSNSRMVVALDPTTASRSIFGGY